MFGSLVAFDLGDPKGASDGRLQGVGVNWNPCRESRRAAVGLKRAVTMSKWAAISRRS